MTLLKIINCIIVHDVKSYIYTRHWQGRGTVLTSWCTLLDCIVQLITTSWSVHVFRLKSWTRYRLKAGTNAKQLADKTLQRPRKTGARFTNSNIAPDEHLQPNLSMDFDGKRDRWNGYSLDEHKKIVEEFQKIEEVEAKFCPKHPCLSWDVAPR